MQLGFCAVKVVKIACSASLNAKRIPVGSSDLGKGSQTFNAQSACKYGFVSEQIWPYFETESENQKSEIIDLLEIN